MLSPGLILAIAFAMVHGFGTGLPIFFIIPRFRWASFSGGVSLSNPNFLDFVENKENIVDLAQKYGILTP